MAAQVHEVDIGFLAGQVLTLKLTEEQYRALVDGLSGEGNWLEVTTEDCELVIDANKVAYVRRTDRAQRVGFGNA